MKRADCAGQGRAGGAHSMGHTAIPGTSTLVLLEDLRRLRTWPRRAASVVAHDDLRHGPREELGSRPHPLMAGFVDISRLLRSNLSADRVTNLTYSVHSPASEDIQVPTNTIPFVAVFFWWPAVVLSLALTLTGIAVGRWRVALAGILISSPFLLYLFGSPRIGWLSLVVGALYLGSDGLWHARSGRWRSRWQRRSCS